MKNKGIGFYFTLLGCLAALIAMILYSGAMYKTTPVYVLLVLVIVLEVVGILVNKKPVNNWLPVLNAALIAFAVAHSFSVMVNQIGYVYAGLDTIDTLTGFITFAVVGIVGMILYIIAGFLPQTKD